MALEVWNGSSWASMTDPEIWNGSAWVNINKGEIWNGSSWVAFYFRNANETYSDLDTVDKTFTSIKIGVNHTGTDRRRAVVWISGQFLTTAQTTSVFTTNMVSSNTSAQLNFTGLTRGTSYDFDSYIEYLDSSDNVLFTGPSMLVLHTDSTLDYVKTVPTTPVNTGTITSTSLSFSSSSNANYSINGATAYIQFRLYDYPGGTLQATENSSNLPSNDTTTSRTVTFTGLSYNTAYYCTARTYYGSPVSGYSSGSDPSNVVSTHPLHTPATPTKVDGFTSDTVLTMVSTGNAYNNGTAYMQWERSSRTAGSSGAWTVTTFNDSGNLLTNDATTRFVSYAFSANQTDEYRFRARVYYSTLGVYGPYSSYSATVRPKLWVRTYIPSFSGYAAASESSYFSTVIFANSSENGAAEDYLSSDNNSGTQWEAYPYKTVSGTESRVRSLAFFQRAATFGQNAYFVTEAFDFDPAYPNVSTVVASLSYGINTLTLQKGGNVRIVLNSSSRIDLVNGDFVRVVGSSSSTYNQTYLVSSAAGDTVFATPYNSAISSPSSASGGSLRVDTSRGIDVTVFGGTSARTSSTETSVTRTDADYPYDVPTSAAFGSVSYTVTTSTKVAKTSSDDDFVSILFRPILPAGYRDATLEGVAIQIGGVAASRIQVYMNGTGAGDLKFDSGGFGTIANGWIYLSGFSLTPTYADYYFYIKANVFPGYYAGDGLYYSTIKEIQLRYSYETLTG
jgi:hypothetical protein